MTKIKALYFETWSVSLSLHREARFNSSSFIATIGMLATSLAIRGFANYITNATKEQQKNLKFGTCSHMGQQKINKTLIKKKRRTKNNELYKECGPHEMKRRHKLRKDRVMTVKGSSKISKEDQKFFLFSVFMTREFAFFLFSDCFTGVCDCK